MNTTTIITIAVVGIMCGYAIYLLNQQKGNLTNLHGIVTATIIGSLTGLICGYLFGVLSGDLFLSAGIGIIIGFVFGFLAGQPTGILPILIGSVTGLMSGIIGAIFGITIKSQNPYLMLIILLVFFVIILGFVILFIKVETDEKLRLDTKAISPFVIISSGVVLIILFLFLYSSDIIKAPSTDATVQAQQNDTANTNSSGSSSASGTEVDVTNQQAPKVKIEVTETGYSPNIIRVKKGTKVELDVHNSVGNNSCLSILNIPDFHLTNISLKTETTPLSFTPESTGQYTFSCGMNMFKGTIIVQ